MCSLRARSHNVPVCVHLLTVLQTTERKRLCISFVQWKIFWRHLITFGSIKHCTSAKLPWRSRFESDIGWVSSGSMHLLTLPQTTEGNCTDPIHLKVQPDYRGRWIMLGLMEDFRPKGISYCKENTPSVFLWMNISHAVHWRNTFSKDWHKFICCIFTFSLTSCSQRSRCSQQCTRCGGQIH